MFNSGHTHFFISAIKFLSYTDPLIQEIMYIFEGVGR